MGGGSSRDHHWGYGKKNGPANWVKYAPAAKGKSQSPVNIDTKACTYDPHLHGATFSINYNNADAVSLFNNGHSIQVELSDSSSSFFTGGPAGETNYQLKQFHFHWGSKNGVGSEHKVDGKSYSAELHLVHWNTTYPSFEEALENGDGLAVLTVFIDIGDSHNELNKLTSLFPSVMYPNERVNLNGSFNIIKLFPENLDDFWTYSGSLTTPPCLEVVTFIIFKQPITISEDQISAFRSLKTSPASREMDEEEAEGYPLVDNYRPVMPLGKRVIFASFQ